ncbi:hypothetical protein KEN51_CDS0164 [Pseudomonas phage vB_Pae10145-KEN51]|uniref:Uncharacterized protein n=7 Tax=root TaxID=1 RepID=A0AAE7S7V9_9CAUD|nr:hypothetical protein [Pseudomonas aeruginosa]YP_009619657.1 hypothetical protein FDJ06_gp117 [Pseudomonas phage SL2]ANM45020.1 hypothetical protein KTN4_262 [Pseudomonas phage KTN4]QGK89892.1 hypothetical protein [Pseudomonas phage vB_PA32_GUMS]QJB22897.1 hypothetical protein fnug_254 [Pseudomonas phage fnug]QOV08109.1 hypothetical protein [Pseudomonas phage vB_PaeM_kmuB]QXN68460.1 hypothetical protein [Pseudomonas phage PA7]UNI71617.1 hypothetical protein Churi01_gp096 [Pseudomonas phage
MFKRVMRYIRVLKLIVIFYVRRQLGLHDYCTRKNTIALDRENNKRVQINAISRKVEEALFKVELAAIMSKR